ncbi:MAG: FAD-dependent oxidoreductase [Nitrospirae bacterium]|nr:FAD-dependent oxidoreductase [Nitrospirota bacterium]
MNITGDVLVVGAGVAGVSAAVAAARGGSRTMLIEKERYLGGTGTAGMFQHICGLYLNGDAAPTETLNQGLAREFAALLSVKSPQRTMKKMGRVYVHPYSSEDLQSVLTSLCSAEQNITVRYDTAAIAVTKRSSGIESIKVKGPDGEQVISPKMVIDCTGSGEIAALAGAEFDLSSPEERQLAGFTLHIKGLQGADDALALKVPYHLAQAVKQGTFSPTVRFTTFSPGDAITEGYCKMSIDTEEGPRREEQTRKEAAAVHAYLASVIPAFNGSFIAGTSLKVLEREGRRVMGEYTLTKDDVLSARKFSDGIVKNAWPIELWDRLKGTVYYYVPRGDYYEIPFRCITVKNVENLLTAGRCISVTREALGSTRVMGACVALGEQAGKAAAYRVRNGKYPENIKEY